MLFERHGFASLALCRAVPVMAEASVLLAGAAQMPLRKTLIACAPANAGIALVYAGIGAYALQLDAFLLAFAAAVVVPGIMYGLFQMYSPRTFSESASK